MYDSTMRRWASDCADPELLRWCQEPANASQPQAQFLRASDLLSRSGTGDEAAQGVELMERAAQSGHPPAMFAMGQLFHWGWAVHRDRKLAREWYRKAAAANYAPAREELRREKQKMLLFAGLACAAVVVCAALAYGAFRLARAASGQLFVTVHSGTQLSQPDSYDSFDGAVQDIIAGYDSDDMVSGQVPTNRVVLKCLGSSLDLSAFAADEVIVREDGLVVIQFSSREEAERCVAQLEGRSDILYVELDSYIFQEEMELLPDLPAITTTAPQAGYYSWGTADMGLDQLSQYVAEHFPDRSVIVAVVDCGVLRWQETSDRLLPGVNMATGGNIVPDVHGTHVAGIILDSTRGTNTMVLPVDVYGGREGTTQLLMAEGISYAVRAGAQVINLSQGYSTTHSSAVEQAALEAVQAGVVFVKSAGNSASDPSCPGELEELLVVGAYDYQHQIAYFSNYGESVDICAPGVDIYSYSHEQDGRLVSLQGTSMAAPHAAALAALICTLYPDATPQQVELYITDYCRTDRNPDAYATGLYGAGAPNAAAFIEMYPD